MNTMLAVLALAGAPAALSADRATVDRGTVKAGPALSHSFRVKNTAAGETVTITGIEASCGCVRHAVGQKSLAAGETTEVAVEVNSLTQPAGPNTWRFTLVYAVGSGPPRRLDLFLQATLVREVTVTPPMLEVSTEGAATVELTVSDVRTPPLAVTSASPTAKFLTATVQPGDASGRTTVRVTVAADASAGVHDETVLLTTSDPAYPELRVPVRVTKRAKDAVRAYPDAIEQRDGPAVVQLRRADGGPVEIETATATGGLAVRWSAGAGPVATVRVAEGGGPGAVTVVLKKPAGGRVVIPVGRAD